MLRRFVLFAVLVSLAAPASLHAGKVSAEKGKKYPLTRKHGPWMIMVASFQPIRQEFRTDGLSPEQAADELVYELRSRGLPAYAWAVDSQVETVEATGRDGTPQNRVFAAMHGGICVLAGNYPSASDDRATKALAAVKKFQPKVLEPQTADARGRRVSSTGGVFRITPGRSSGPLAGAFMTVNPLLSPEEARAMSRRRDPLLIKLNGGQDYALHTADGKYTVVVATFTGNSIVQVEGRRNQAMKQFEVGDGLDRAGKEAWQLCHVLRSRKVEAYVWHERSRSIVTVGSFDSPDDPRIARVIRGYSPKPEIDRKTGRPMTDPNTGGPVELPYRVTIPAKPRTAGELEHQWVFNMLPYAMPVPQL